VVNYLRQKSIATPTGPLDADYNAQERFESGVLCRGSGLKGRGLEDETASRPRRDRRGFRLRKSGALSRAARAGSEGAPVELCGVPDDSTSMPRVRAGTRLAGEYTRLDCSRFILLGRSSVTVSYGGRPPGDRVSSRPVGIRLA
jgi:hypothetical protein